MVRNELKSVIENNTTECKEKEFFLRSEIEVLQTDIEDKERLYEEIEEKMNISQNNEK